MTIIRFIIHFPIGLKPRATQLLFDILLGLSSGVAVVRGRIIILRSLIIALMNPTARRMEMFLSKSLWQQNRKQPSVNRLKDISVYCSSLPSRTQTKSCRSLVSLCACAFVNRLSCYIIGKTSNRNLPINPNFFLSHYNNGCVYTAAAFKRITLRNNVPETDF